MRCGLALMDSRRATRLLLISMTLGLLGCSSAAERADRASRTAQSWTATARRTSKALAAGAVPRVYAAQMLEAALQTKSQLEQRPEWRSVAPEIRSHLADAARELASSIHEGSDSMLEP
jgi:hypothetical protein